jgi:hypothetical protein
VFLIDFQGFLIEYLHGNSNGIKSWLTSERLKIKRDFYDQRTFIEMFGVWKLLELPTGLSKCLMTKHKFRAIRVSLNRRVLM